MRASALFLSTSDTIAPTLTGATDTATGESTGQGQVSTNEGNGTAYAVVTQSSTTPSVAQVQAGQDHTGTAADWDGSQAVSATGVLTFNATGLVASTSYFFHFQHQDAATNDSTVVSADGFTTDAVLSAVPLGHQRLDNQYMAIAASRLNGVLQ